MLLVWGCWGGVLGGFGVKIFFDCFFTLNPPQETKIRNNILGVSAPNCNPTKKKFFFSFCPYTSLRGGSEVTASTEPPR